MVIYTDGAARGNPGPAAIAVVFSDGTEHAEAIGVATNNEAEYKALIKGLEMAAAQGLADVEFRTDSQLLEGHLAKGWRVNKNEALVARASELSKRFARFRIVSVPRRENARADRLCNDALDALGR